MSVVIARVGGIYGPMYQTLNHPIASMRYAAAHGTTAKYGRGVFFADDGCSYCYVKDCTTGIQLVDVADSLPHKIYNTSGGVTSNLSNAKIVEVIRNVVKFPELKHLLEHLVMDYQLVLVWPYQQKYASKTTRLS